MRREEVEVIVREVVEEVVVVEKINQPIRDSRGLVFACVICIACLAGTVAALCVALKANATANAVALDDDTLELVRAREASDASQIVDLHRHVREAQATANQALSEAGEVSNQLDDLVDTGRGKLVDAGLKISRLERQVKSLQAWADKTQKWEHGLQQYIIANPYCCRPAPQ